MATKDIFQTLRELPAKTVEKIVERLEFQGLILYLLECAKRIWMHFILNLNKKS